MDTLLFATDFSASHAANYAAALSNTLAVKQLLLYHSYELLPTSVDIPESKLIAPEVIYQNSMQRLERMKAEMQQMLNPGTKILTFADPLTLEKGINCLAQEYGVELVAIGLTGKNKLERLLMGSSTGRLLRKSKLPLLVIPENCRYTAIDRVVFASDFRDVSTTTPSVFIKDLCYTLGADLLVLNVDPNEADHFGSRFIMEQRALHHMFDDIGAAFYYTDHKDTDEGILLLAEEKDAQLIIVVAKPHGFMDQLFNKSVSRQLALFSKLPVMIIHS